MYRMVTVEGGKTHLASAKESTGSKSLDLSTRLGAWALFPR